MPVRVVLAAETTRDQLGGGTLGAPPLAVKRDHRVVGWVAPIDASDATVRAYLNRSPTATGVTVFAGAMAP